MNESMATVFGLLGGLALFIFGCRVRNVGGRTCNGSSAEFQCDNRIGNRFCQRRIDVLKAGYLCYLRCEHRNNDDSTADGI